MALFGKVVDVRKIAITSSASTWGKLMAGAAKLVLAEPCLAMVVGTGLAGALLAAFVAMLVVRAAPEKATVMAIIGVPLPAVLDARVRRQLLGVLAAVLLLARTRRPARR